MLKVSKPRDSKYLFGKVFGFPGSCERGALPLLRSLSLFQAVLVLRGGIDVPLLQRVGDVLPQAPAQGEEHKGGEREQLYHSPALLNTRPVSSRLRPQYPCQFSNTVAWEPSLLGYSSHLWTTFSDSLSSQYFAVPFSQQTLFMFFSPPELFFFSKQVDLFLLSPGHIPQITGV